MNNLEIMTLGETEIKFMLKNHEYFTDEQVRLAAKREILFVRMREAELFNLRYMGFLEDMRTRWRNPKFDMQVVQE